MRLSSVADVWLWPHDRAIDRDELLRRVVDARGLYCMLTDRIDAELLDAAPELIAVSTMAVGVDNIDIASCRARGIAIGHTPDVLTDSTADLAWALLMASSRRLGEGIDYVRGGLWGQWEPDALLGRDVANTTVGIIGMGRIGAGVARRAQGFSMDIVYASRSSHPPIEHETGARRLTLEELLAVADHVVVCVALSDDTRGLIDAEALARMQPTANLINVARDPLSTPTPSMRRSPPGPSGAPHWMSRTPSRSPEIIPSCRFRTASSFPTSAQRRRGRGLPWPISPLTT